MKTQNGVSEEGTLPIWVVRKDVSEIGPGRRSQENILGRDQEVPESGDKDELCISRWVDGRDRGQHS